MEGSQGADEHAWPVGGGEMGARIRAFDWASTPLGSLDGWPVALRLAVGTILDSPFPAAVVWGPALVTINNDGFRPILGAKADALGHGFDAIWAEAWSTIGPLAARALAGEATFIEDFPLVVERGAGPEEAFFTFAYSPLRDETGAVVGFLDTVIETTARILTDRQRKATEAALRASEERLRLAARAARISTFQIDVATGTVEFDANVFAMLYGLEAVAPDRHPPEWKALVGAWLRPEDARRHTALLQATMRGEGDLQNELPVRNPATGAEDWIETQATLVRDTASEPGRVVGIMRNITERKAAEAALRASEERQAFLLMLNDRLRALSDPGQIMAAAAEALGRHLDLAVVQYLLIGPDGEAYEVAAEYGDGRLPRVQGYRGRIADHGPGWGPQFRAGEAIFSDDHELRPDDAAASRAFGVRSGSAIPLVTGKRLVAILATGHPVPRRWTDAEKLLQREVAERTWAAVERARAEAALRESEARQTFLLRLNDSLRPLGDVVAIEREVTRLLGEALGADRVFYAAIESDGDTGEIRADYVRGVPSGVGRYSLAAFAPALVPEWRDGRATATTDVDTDQRFTDAQRAAYATVQARAALGVPLLKGGHLVALLALNSAAPRVWTVAEIALVEAVAERTWAAMERARAEEALRESEARQAFLLRLGDDLRPIADPVEVQGAVTRAALDFFAVDRCYYCEVEGTDVVVRRDASRADLPSVVGIYPLASMPTFRAALAAGRPYGVEDAHTAEVLDEELRQVCIQLEIIAFINVPVIKRGKPVGIFCVTLRTPRRWTDADLSLAQEIAERTWAAVERARTEAALAASEERLQLAVAAARLAIFTWDLDTDTIVADAPIRRLLRLAPGAPLRGADVLVRAVHPEDRAAVAAALATAREPTADGRFEIEFRAPLHGGQARWVHATGQTYFAGAGDARRAVRVVGTGLDITERKVIEAALRDSEERARLAVEAADLATWDWDLDTDLVRWNARHFTMFGLPPDPEPVPSARFFEYVHPDDRARVGAALLGALGTGSLFAAEFRAVGADGATRWMSGYGRVVATAGDRPTRMAGAMLDVTARREAEDRLRASEARARALVAGLPGGAAFVVDRALRYQLAEGEALAERGLSPAALVGKTVAEALGPALAAHHIPHYERALAGVPFEVEHAEAGRTYLTRGVPLRADDDTVTGVLVISTNITALKVAEAALRASEARQRFLLDLGDRMRAEGTADGVIAVATRALGERLGASRIVFAEIDEPAGLARIRVGWEAPGIPPHPPELRLADFGGPLLAALRAGEIVRFDDLGPAPPARDDLAALDAIAVRAGISVPLLVGGRFVVNLNVHQVHPRAWTDDEVALAAAVAERTWGAVERARTEAALAASEARFRGFAEASADTLWIVGAADGWLEFLSPSFERMFGAPRAAVMAQPGHWDALMHPDDRATGAALLPRALAGEMAQADYRIVRPDDGSVRWVRDTAFPIRDDTGAVVRAAGIAQDVTGDRQAGEALAASEGRFRAVAELVPDLLWRSEPDGTTTWYNRRWREYTGQTAAAARGWGWIDAIHPDDRAASARRYREAVERGAPFQQEHRIRAADDTYRWFLVQAEPTRDEAGRVVAWYGAATDIHEQRREREELAALVASATVELRALSHRLLLVQEEERRHLARELHDEIGQQLTGLDLQLAAARRDGGGTAAALADAGAIARELTARVRELSLDLRPAALDSLGLLPALLNHLARFRARTGVAVDLRHDGLEHPLPPAAALVAFRVVQEALTNVARHAGVGAATVTVLADGALFLAIRDAGRGFDQTATPTPGGLGGLRERVALLGGTLEVESAPGEGTTVTAELPLDGTSGDVGADDAAGGER